MHIKQPFELWILLCINKDSLVLFLSSLQSSSYTDLPQGQFVSELKIFVALKEQYLCLRTAIKVGQNLV